MSVFRFLVSASVFVSRNFGLWFRLRFYQLEEPNNRRTEQPETYEGEAEIYRAIHVLMYPMAQTNTTHLATLAHL
jgi:hypothetical protein